MIECAEFYLNKIDQMGVVYMHMHYISSFRSIKKDHMKESSRSIKKDHIKQQPLSLMYENPFTHY